MFLLALTIIIAVGYFINHKLKLQKNSSKTNQRFVSHSKDYSYCFILWSLIAIIAIFCENLAISIFNHFITTHFTEKKYDLI